MKDEAKRNVLSKDQLKAKLDELGDEIKYRVEEAKKSGNSVGGAHKTDIGELMKEYRMMKEAYGRILNTEKESLQLEDILSTLAEEKEEDSKKVKEREEIQASRIESFGELIDLVTQIKSALPKAKKETEKFYKTNPKSYAVVFPTDKMKEDLADILEKLVGKEETVDESVDDNTEE
jgi:recombinational DNA repair ATPase RecF